MKNLYEHAQMVSTLASAFNHREPFLNGDTAATEQKISTHTVGNPDDFDLPECLKNLSLEDIFVKCNLSDNEFVKLK